MIVTQRRARLRHTRANAAAARSGERPRCIEVADFVFERGPTKCMERLGCYVAFLLDNCALRSGLHVQDCGTAVVGVN